MKLKAFILWFIGLFTSIVATAWVIEQVSNNSLVTSEPLKLEYNIKTDGIINLQAFYTESREAEFSETKSTVITSPSGGDFHIVTLSLPCNNIEALRLDFGEYPGEIEIKDIKLKKGDVEKIITDIVAEGTALGMELTKSGDVIKIFSNEVDPLIIIEVSFGKGIPSKYGFDYFKIGYAFLIPFLIFINIPLVKDWESRYV